jgi:hypothetical protein
METVSVGMSTYGPFNDGQSVFDAAHITNEGVSFERAYQAGSKPKLETPISHVQAAIGCWLTHTLQLDEEDIVHRFPKPIMEQGFGNLWEALQPYLGTVYVKEHVEWDLKAAYLLEEVVGKSLPVDGGFEVKIADLIQAGVTYRPGTSENTGKIRLRQPDTPKDRVILRRPGP